MTIQDYVQRLFAHMGVDDVQVEVEETDKSTIIKVRTQDEDSGLVIGAHGETLSALQRLIYLSFREQLTDKKVILHVNDYLEQRELKLKEMLDQAVETVAHTQRSFRFYFLSPRERMMIHTMVSEDPELADYTTFSQGEGRDRRLYLSLKNDAPAGTSKTSEKSAEVVPTAAVGQDEPAT